MKYEVIYDDDAIGFLAKLPKDVRMRIFNKVADTKVNPLHFFERLEGRKDYKLRIGDYRAIADIRKERIEVTMIGHRKNIYKRLDH